MGWRGSLCLAGTLIPRCPGNEFAAVAGFMADVWKVFGSFGIGGISGMLGGDNGDAGRAAAASADNSSFVAVLLLLSVCWRARVRAFV